MERTHTIAGPTSSIVVPTYFTAESAIVITGEMIKGVTEKQDFLFSKHKISPLHIAPSLPT